MKSLILAASALTVLSLGCSKKEEPHPSVIPDTKFSMSSVQSGDFTDYNVTLTRPLSQQRTLIIVASVKPWLDRIGGDPNVYFSDMLKQDDDKSISFDCDAIAEKIIDTNLVEEITPLCKWGHDKANQYWKGLDYQPNEFTDSLGTRWKKVQ